MCGCAGNTAGPELEAGSPTSQPAVATATLDGRESRGLGTSPGWFLSHPYSFASSARDSSLKPSFVLILAQVKHVAAISLRMRVTTKPEYEAICLKFKGKR